MRSPNRATLVPSDDRRRVSGRRGLVETQVATQDVGAAVALHVVGIGTARRLVVAVLAVDDVGLRATRQPVASEDRTRPGS